MADDLNAFDVMFGDSGSEAEFDRFKAEDIGPDLNYDTKRKISLATTIYRPI